MDFLGLTPHASKPSSSDQPNFPNMTELGWESLATASELVNAEGGFVAIAGTEWSTNSSGNHVGIYGAKAVSKVERGRYDLLYDGFLRDRRALGERPLLMLNHPRTFREHPEFLNGSWDQIFGVNLLDLPKAGERGKKFNDYGLDDFSPLKELLPSWIEGLAMPDEAAVAEGLQVVRKKSEPYARLMEVLVARGTEFGSETPQNPSLGVDDQGEVSRRTRVHDDYDYYLLHGFRLAPAASHDNHYANWGTGHSSRTAVLARGLSSKSLHDSIDRRRVYASEDENLDLRFYLDDRVAMGYETGRLARDAEFAVHVSDPDYAGAYEVRIYRGTVGGASVEEVATSALTEAGWARFELNVDGAAGETAFFYAEVLETGANRMAWSAPIWLELY
jgi:hypothetical protein